MNILVVILHFESKRQPYHISRLSQNITSTLPFSIFFFIQNQPSHFPITIPFFLSSISSSLSVFQVSTFCIYIMSSLPSPSPSPSPSSSKSTSHYFTPRAATYSTRAFHTRRPWEEVFALRSFTRPFSLNEAWERVRRNFTHFRVNYTMIVLFIIFLSLLWHPISIIVFLVILVPWCFLYFFRDAPVEVFHRTVDGRVVEVALSALTVVGLCLTGVSLNVLVAAVAGVAACVMHAAFRSTEDLYVEENEAYDGGLPSVVGGSPTKRTTRYNLI